MQHIENLDVCALVGTSSIERMKQNVAALDISLTIEEAAYLDLK